MQIVSDSASCWHSIVFACRRLCISVKFPLKGLDLVNGPLGLLQACVYYMCTDLSSYQRLNAFLAKRINEELNWTTYTVETKWFKQKK